MVDMTYSYDDVLGNYSRRDKACGCGCVYMKKMTLFSRTFHTVFKTSPWEIDHLPLQYLEIMELSHSLWGPGVNALWISPGVSWSSSPAARRSLWVKSFAKQFQNCLYFQAGILWEIFVVKGRDILNLDPSCFLERTSRILRGGLEICSKSAPWPQLEHQHNSVHSVTSLSCLETFPWRKPQPSSDNQSLQSTSQF